MCGTTDFNCLSGLGHQLFIDMENTTQQSLKRIAKPSYADDIDSHGTIA